VIRKSARFNISGARKRSPFLWCVLGTVRLWALPLAAVLALAACEKVSPEAIERWKSTVKGPDKLQESFVNGAIDPSLRAQAAVALQSLGKSELVAKDLKGMPDGDRSEVVSALLKLHAATIAAASTTALVQDARDGLFAIRDYTSGAERSSLDASLMAAIEQQMMASGKLGGSQSLSKIVEALGEDSAPLLVKLMALPKAPHAELADLLAKVGDEPSKSQAGDALLIVARKTHAVEPGIWRALGLLANPSIVKYLQEQVDKSSWQQAEQAARALGLQPHPELAEFAVSRAANGKLHGNVREEMFTLAGTCCRNSTVPGLSNIIKRSNDALVKYRTYEAILKAAGPQGIEAGLDGFPAKAAYKPEDVEDFLVKETVKLGESARPALLALLKANSALKRMVAVLCLAKLGKPDDARHLRTLTKDKGLVKGFPKGRSVGQEAVRVASLLAKGA